MAATPTVKTAQQSFPWRLLLPRWQQALTAASVIAAGAAAVVLYRPIEKMVCMMTVTGYKWILFEGEYPCSLTPVALSCDVLEIWLTDS